MKISILVALCIQSSLVFGFISSDHSQSLKGIEEDYISKSQETLDAIQNFTFKLQTHNTALNTSDLVISGMQDLYSYIDQIGSPGFAIFRYGDDILKLSNTSYYVKKIIEQLDSIQGEYYSYVYYLLKDKQMDSCIIQLNHSYSVIMDVSIQLYNYFQFYEMGNPDYLMKQFILANQNDISLNAINILLNSLAGNFEQGGCDLLTALYDGNTRLGYYQGNRDYMTNVAAFIVDVTILGITARSAYMSFVTERRDQWLIEQSKYLLLLKNAYKRIIEYDKLTTSDSSVAWNAKQSLKTFLKELPGDLNFTQISQATQQFLTKTYPNKYWIVYVYQNVQGQGLHSWQCVNCFAALNVLSKYHMLVAFVDRTEVPDYTILQDKLFEDTINNYVNKANDLTKDWFSKTCIMGVFATSGDITGGFGGIPEFIGIQVMQSKTTIKTTVAIWAIKGLCPHQDMET